MRIAINSAFASHHKFYKSKAHNFSILIKFYIYVIITSTTRASL